MTKWTGIISSPIDFWENKQTNKQKTLFVYVYTCWADRFNQFLNFFWSTSLNLLSRSSSSNNVCDLKLKGHLSFLSQLWLNSHTNVSFVSSSFRNTEVLYVRGRYSHKRVTLRRVLMLRWKPRTALHVCIPVCVHSLKVNIPSPIWVCVEALDDLCARWSVFKKLKTHTNKKLHFTHVLSCSSLSSPRLHYATHSLIELLSLDAVFYWISPSLLQPPKTTAACSSPGKLVNKMQEVSHSRPLAVTVFCSVPQRRQPENKPQVRL